MTDQNPAPQGQPLPGEQYPAATLPPSEPFPAQSPPSDPFPPPGPPPPQFAAPPRKPRNKPAIVLAIVAAVFIAATGVLGTLFIVEQGDHKRTSGELGTVRDELDSAKQSATHAADELKRKTARIDQMQGCVSAALKYLEARTEAEAETLFDNLYDSC
jgi:hypothetical protein